MARIAPSRNRDWSPRERNQLSSTNFPFGAGRHFLKRWRFRGIARPAARNRFPTRGAEESIMSSRVRLWKWMPRQLHPRRSNIIGKTVPSLPTHSSIYVSKLLVVALRSRNPPRSVPSPSPQRASPDRDGREQPPSPLSRSPFLSR